MRISASKMLWKVRRYINQQQLFNFTTDKFIVAVSGGVDSVVLLHVLLNLLGRERLLVAHCNFQLRDEESERDMAFVEDLCREHGVAYQCKRFNTLQYAQQQKISIEMAARELRYEWFEQLRERLQYDFIAVAHQQDDQAETLLLNLLRGTGIRGLQGMLPKNQHIVRPLLCVNRKQIEEYAQKNTLSFVNDRTNDDPTFKRNHIRLMLKQFRTSEIANIANTCSKMAQYVQLIDWLKVKFPLIHQQNEYYLFDSQKFIEQFGALPALFYEALSPFGFAPKMIEKLYKNCLENNVGKRLIADNFTAEIRQKHLEIAPILRQTCPPTIITKQIDFQKDVVFPESWRNVAYFDASKIILPLTLRHWRAGDKFQPLGMQQQRKVSDFFTDKHLSKAQKERTWLLCEGENIIWIVGHRIDERYKVTEKTERICVITVL